MDFFGNFDPKHLVLPAGKDERRQQKLWREAEKYIDTNAQPVTEKIIAEIGEKTVFLVEIKSPAERRGQWTDAVIKGLGAAVSAKLERLGVNLALNHETTARLSTEEVNGKQIGLPSGFTGYRLTDPVLLVFESSDSIKKSEYEPGDWLQSD